MRHILFLNIRHLENKQKLFLYTSSLDIIHQKTNSVWKEYNFFYVRKKEHFYIINLFKINNFKNRFYVRLYNINIYVYVERIKVHLIIHCS